MVVVHDSTGQAARSGAASLLHHAPFENHNCRKQAFSQVCAVCSPFFGSISVMAILRQLSCADADTCVQSLGNANIRCVELQDLAEEYKGKTDEELLRLALNPTELTPEANSVLNDELARRRINSAERLTGFREEEDQRKAEQRAGKLESYSSSILMGLVVSGLEKLIVRTTPKRAWSSLRQPCLSCCSGFHSSRREPFSWRGSVHSSQTK